MQWKVLLLFDYLSPSVSLNYTTQSTFFSPHQNIHTNNYNISEHIVNRKVEEASSLRRCHLLLDEMKQRKDTKLTFYSSPAKQQMKQPKSIAYPVITWKFQMFNICSHSKLQIFQAKTLINLKSYLEDVDQWG